MKIIFVMVNMAGGGAERVISILANRFVKLGNQVAILMTAGDTVAYELDPAIELFCAGSVSGGSMKKRLERIKNMRRFLKKNRDAVLVSFGPGTSFFTVLADLFLDHPLCISERNDPAACGHPYLRNLIYARADRLVFQTEDAMQSFPEKLRKKGCVIPNPVMEGLPSAFLGEREKTIVAVGRLQPQKNYGMLLKAFARFHKKYPEYSLHIYGKGEMLEELQKEAQQLQINAAVVWEGFRKDVLSCILSAGMYVLPSNYEGISNALLEAMAIGLPVISTDCPIGGSKMCIQDGKNGLLVPCGEEEKFAEAMMHLAEDREYADALGKEAANIRSSFSEETISQKWLDELSEIRK